MVIDEPLHDHCCASVLARLNVQGRHRRMVFLAQEGVAQARGHWAQWTKEALCLQGLPHLVRGKCYDLADTRLHYGSSHCSYPSKYHAIVK